MRHHAFWIVLGIAALWQTGCAEKRVDVSGKVTYNGAPLHKSGGQIIFVGDKGEPVPADIGPDGEYQATGVPAGLNRVVISYANPVARKGKPFPKKGQPASMDPAPAPFLTPSKYATVETSGLSVEVEAGTVYNVNMEGPKIP
jgi:hypothetical protein